jgi:hypothetical protein
MLDPRLNHARGHVEVFVGFSSLPGVFGMPSLTSSNPGSSRSPRFSFLRTRRTSRRHDISISIRRLISCESGTTQNELHFTLSSFTDPSPRSSIRPVPPYMFGASNVFNEANFYDLIRAFPRSNRRVCVSGTTSSSKVTLIY